MMTDRNSGRTVVYQSRSNKTSATVSATMDDSGSRRGYALVYKEHGDPSVVLRKEEFLIPEELKSDEVLVKILAAPINPSDTLCIQGYYANKPPLPATGGFEGVGQVIQVASDVTEVQPGDRVVPGEVENTGTWRTHAVWKGNNLRKIPNDIPVLAAATIAVNPCTAYRMLHDFVKLQPGDVVIQNGANSGVGEAVIQIARYLELVTINVVRSRPDIEELRVHLSKLGADQIVTEEEISNEDFRNSLGAQPKLALDCVGGQSASALLDSLAPGGTMATYGAMSRQPVTASTSNLIFKDVRLRGFWMTQWKKDNSCTPEAITMIEFLCKLIREGKLSPPLFEKMQLDDYQAAIQKSMSGFKGVKAIFIMNGS